MQSKKTSKIQQSAVWSWTTVALNSNTSVPRDDGVLHSPWKPDPLNSTIGSAELVSHQTLKLHDVSRVDLTNRRSFCQQRPLRSCFCIGSSISRAACGNQPPRENVQE